MSRYRNALPQLRTPLALADGGLETTLVFHEGVELPYFAAFDLLRRDGGAEMLDRYFRRYIDIARRHRLPLVLETVTWRASADWGARLGYDARGLDDANRRAVELMLALREAEETAASPIVVSGNLGPRGDGYRADTRMSAEAARDYHAPQVESLAASGPDMLSAFTLNYVEEAIGIAHAAARAGMPLALSFTVETDGHLPSGAILRDAIRRTDDATGGYPAYYMINCAHPTHFAHVLHDAGEWRSRIRGVRANASKRSHAELDECTDLDAGDPAELGGQYRELREALPALAVVGGCCGTDHRHVEAICAALMSADNRKAMAA